MKIISGKYREEQDWQRWIEFTYPHGSRLNLVFLRRLAALARDYNHKMTNILGYRPIEETQRLYDADVKKYGKPSGKVSTPGTSWHEHSLAVDLDGSFWREVSESIWVPKSRLKQDLNEYGLMLPLNRVDSPGVIEWWHLQPMETNGIPGVRRKTFLDPDDEIYGGEKMNIKDFQRMTGLVTDGIAGPKTKAKAQEVQTIIHQILGGDLQAENAALKQRLNDIRVKATL